MTINSIALIPGFDAATRYYLSNQVATPYTGSGTPWTAQATTPYQIAMNDVGGARWTPQAAVPIVQYEGGPPFRNGSNPRTFAYPNVTETIPIQIQASGATATLAFNNAIYLKQKLSQILNTASYQHPCILEIAPQASTAGYCRIWRAEVQEDPRFLNDEAGIVQNGRALLRVLVTWVREPHSTAASGGGLFTGDTFTNNGANASSMTVASELAYEGLPMNVTLDGGTLATAGIKTIWAAVVDTADLAGRGDAISTASTTGVTIGSAVSHTIRFHEALRMRFLARVAAPTSTLRMRAVVTWPSSNTVIYTGPWIAPSSTSGAVFDFGFLDLPSNMRRAGGGTTQNVSVSYQAKSTSGTATGTLTWVCTLDYFTFCKIVSPSVAASTVFTLRRFANGLVSRYPVDPPIACAGDASAASIVPNCAPYGTLPLAYANSSLWLAWDAAGVHTDTDTISVTASYLPLYRTLLGGATI